MCLIMDDLFSTMTGRKNFVGADDDGNTPTFKLFGVKIAATTHGRDDSDGAAASCAGDLQGLEKNKSVCEFAGLEKRDKGKPWSEEEHRSFLEGLKKLGKGKWKRISTKFVSTRNCSQVASHAQKHFKHFNTPEGAKKRRRGNSIFDVSLTQDAASSSSAPPTNIIDVDDEPEIMPRVSSLIKNYQAVMPTISWVPIVNYSSIHNAMCVPNFNGAVIRPQPLDARQLGWLQAGARLLQREITKN